MIYVRRYFYPKPLSDETEYPLNKDDITVGRGKGCDIEITDDALSRKHIVLNSSTTSGEHAYIIQKGKS